MILLNNKFDIISTFKFFHLQSSPSKLISKFLYFGILIFDSFFICRIVWRSRRWRIWFWSQLLYFSFQLLVFCFYFLKLFAVSSICRILRFFFFFFFFFYIKLYNLIVAKIEIFSSLCIFSNCLHPTNHFFMNFFIFSHRFNFFKILFVNVFFFLSEVIIAILFAVIFQTRLGNSRFKERNQRVQNLSLLLVDSSQILLNNFLLSGKKLSHFFKTHNG